MKLLICMTPAVLFALFVSPILWQQGSSAGLSLAISLPTILAVAGFASFVDWRE